MFPFNELETMKHTWL